MEKCCKFSVGGEIYEMQGVHNLPCCIKLRPSLVGMLSEGRAITAAAWDLLYIYHIQPVYIIDRKVMYNTLWFCWQPAIPDTVNS